MDSMQTLDDFNEIKIEGLSDEHTMQLYNSLLKKDKYNLLEDVKNQMENCKNDNSPEDIRMFLEELVMINEYCSPQMTRGFMYKEDCKQFLEKIGDKLFPLIADHEEQFEKKGRIKEIFKDEEKLAHLAVTLFAIDTCRIEHGVDLENNQSLKIKPKIKENQNNNSKGRGR